MLDSCAVIGCPYPSRGKHGMCNKHRQRQKRNGHTDPLRESMTVFGETKTVSEWSKDPRSVVAYPVLRSRIKAGWKPEKALSTPTRYGTVLKWLSLNITTAESDACIEWPFATTNGYGVVWSGGSLKRATHVVLELSGHPRPDPPHDNALHSCDNPPCINPLHLRWDTKKVNNQEAAARRNLEVSR